MRKIQTNKIPPSSIFLIDDTKSSYLEIIKVKIRKSFALQKKKCQCSSSEIVEVKTVEDVELSFDHKLPFKEAKTAFFLTISCPFFIYDTDRQKAT